MISAVCWVPRGVTKELPERAEPTEEEVAALRNAAEEEVSEQAQQEGSGDSDTSDDEMDERTAVAQARSVAASLKTASISGKSSSRAADNSSSANKLESAFRELDMEHYDDSDEEQDLMGRLLGSSKTANAYYSDEDADPYITNKDDDDDDSDIEDFAIRETDLLILAARNEDDVNNLEVWLYEESPGGGEPNIYVHHDIMLPAYPLALAWMDCDPAGTREHANIVAVGTFDPAIELWDLDVVDALEPTAALGGYAAKEKPSMEGMSAEEKKKAKKKERKKKAKPALKDGSHEDAVLGLSWNAEYRNVLASASADSTVKVWDVVAGKCEHTLRHHSSKVQAVAWNPVESPVLLTGGFDKAVFLADARAPNAAPAKWELSADVESLCWAPHAPTSFLVSTEDGLVTCLDARGGAGSAPLFRLSAHDKPACALSFCAAAPGLLATASTDKQVKLWDVAGDGPKLLATEDLKVGAVFSASFCRDAPHLLAVAGAKGTVVVWDIRTCAAAMGRYPQLLQYRAPRPAPAVAADS